MACVATEGQSRVNLKPAVWGNYAWSFLYSVALGYPNNPTPQDKSSAVTMLHSLKNLLPCTSCRVNYENELKTHPPEDQLNCAAEFVNYVNTLQNSVSRRLGQRERTVEEAISTVYNNSSAAKLAVSSTNASTSLSNNGKVCPSQYWHLVWIVLLVGLVTSVCTWAITRALTEKKCGRDRAVSL